MFDADRPLGSASIGQCHLAKLKVGREGGEGGREGGRAIYGTPDFEFNFSLYFPPSLSPSLRAPAN